MAGPNVLSCPEMHYDFQAVLKVCIRRQTELTTDNWLYLNELTIITHDL